MKRCDTRNRATSSIEDFLDCFVPCCGVVPWFCRKRRGNGKREDCDQVTTTKGLRFQALGNSDLSLGSLRLTTEVRKCPVKCGTPRHACCDAIGNAPLSKLSSPVFLGHFFRVCPDRTIHQRAHGTPTQTRNAFQVCVKCSRKFDRRRN
jgi:hypothetical protein